MAVIVTSPVAFTVTTPVEASTVALFASEVDHETVLSFAFSGAATAVNVNVSPTFTEAGTPDTVILETLTSVTVTSQLPDIVLPLSNVTVAVIVAVPALTPLTMPSLTVATPSFELAHDIAVTTVPSGDTVTLA